MPNFRKLDRSEVAEIERLNRHTNARYDHLLDELDIVAGGGIELVLEPGESSGAVRRALKNALRRRGLDADWFFDYGSGAKPATRILGLIQEWDSR